MTGKRILAIVACLICVSIPAARATVLPAHGQSDPSLSAPYTDCPALYDFAGATPIGGAPPEVAPNPKRLRLPAGSFAPATLTTDTVESNVDAASNYIGTHHDPDYNYPFRVSGYYQRASYKDLVYLRYQSSTYRDSSRSCAEWGSILNFAATHFWGQDDCTGDDDTVAKDGTIIDSDARPLAIQLQNDQDSNCSLGSFEPPAAPPVPAATALATAAAARLLSDPATTTPVPAVTASAFPCEGDNDDDDSGKAPSSTDDDIQCTLGNQIITGLQPALLCGGDHDSDDPTTEGVGTDPEEGCPVSAEHGGAAPELSIFDCSSVAQALCGAVAFGFSESGVDRMWYDVFAVMVVHQCVAEVDLSSRPEQYGAVQINPALSAAGAILNTQCTGTAPTPTAVPTSTAGP